MSLQDEILAVAMGQPFVLGVLSAFVVFMLWGLASALFGKARKKLNPLASIEHQIQALQSTPLKAVPLLNKQEARILYALEDYFEDSDKRVMAQVCLGEFIQTASRCKNKSCSSGPQLNTCIKCLNAIKAFRAFNSKRVDFLIINRFGQPRIAIEYQGSGHYKGDAVGRDAIKKLCYKKAGIHLLEIPDDFKADDHQSRLGETLHALLTSAKWKHVVLDTHVSLKTTEIR